MSMTPALTCELPIAEQFRPEYLLASGILPLRIVHDRYDPTLADSVVFHYDAFWRVDTLRRTTREFKLTGQTRTLDTLSFAYDTAVIVSGKQWCSRLLSTRDPMGGVSRATYGLTGVGRCLPTSIIGIAGESTQFRYGSLTAGSPAAARPVSVTDPAGLVDSVAYHAATWNSEYMVRRADNAITRAFYNGSGRADSVLDPVGVVSRMRYDRWGRLTHQRTGTGPATRSTFDPGGLVIQADVYKPLGEDFTVLGDSVQSTFTYYNRLGFADSMIGPGGRTGGPNGFIARKQSWANFDRFGHPAWSRTGNGSYVLRTYDMQGRVTWIQRSQVVPGFSVDGERFADPATVTWWNSFLMPMGKSQSAGGYDSLTYDDKGRLAGMKSNDAFLRDTDPVMPNAFYVSQSYGYSKTDELTTETTAFRDGATVVRRYEYNQRGQRTQAVDSTYATGVGANFAGMIRYVYNAGTARLDSIVASVGGAPYAAASFQYDSAGRQVLRRVRSGNGPNQLVTTTAYDNVGRLGALVTVNAQGGTTWSSFTSSAYSKIDELTGYTTVAPGLGSNTQTLAYATDGTRRLLSSILGNVSQGSILSQSWTYDVWGNRTSETASSTIGLLPCVGSSSSRTQTYGPDNRILSQSAIPGHPECGQGIYYTDQAGNRLGDVDTTKHAQPGVPPLISLRTLSSYTATGQLYFSWTPGGTGTDLNWHWYDAQGRQVEAQITTGTSFSYLPHPDSVGGYRTYFVYDGSDVALELTRNQTNHSWRVDRRLVSGGLDAPLAGRFWIGSGYKNLGLVGDRSGTIVAAVDSTGVQDNNAAYFPRDPFGALAGLTGTGGSSLGVGYTGASTPNARGGFVYLRNRWYDPQTGRFLTQDPIGLAGGVNLYAYAGNNPIGFGDPFGLDGIEISFRGYPVTLGTIAGKKIHAPLGHGAVISIDDHGNTRYYEYGRYDAAGRGEVRRQIVPNVVMGKDGRATPESLKRLYEFISAHYGKGSPVDASYYDDADAAKVNAFAEARKNNPDRKPYNLLTNNCKTFAAEAIEAGRAQ